jgi:hypothetical protein
MSSLISSLEIKNPKPIDAEECTLIKSSPSSSETLTSFIKPPLDKKVSTSYIDLYVSKKSQKGVHIDPYKSTPIVMIKRA